MASHHKIRYINLPTSPCPSTLPSPPLSFELVHPTEQIDRPATLEGLGVSLEFLSRLHHRYNRVDFQVMSDARFEEIVLNSVRDQHAKNLYQEEDIEAEIKRRVNNDTSKLDEDVITSRPKTLLEILKVLPNDKQLKFYLIRLLAADNTYDMKSFVAYGISSILGYLLSKAPDNLQSSRKNSYVRQTRLRVTQKSSFQSVNKSKTSSSVDAISLEPASTNTLRRSPRLMGQHSRNLRIEKTVKKSRSTNKH